MRPSEGASFSFRRRYLFSQHTPITGWSASENDLDDQYLPASQSESENGRALVRGSRYPDRQ